jgi:hypothetical protein
MLERVGLTEEAARHYDMALKLRPKDLETATSRALLIPPVLLHAGQFEQRKWVDGLRQSVSVASSI